MPSPAMIVHNGCHSMVLMIVESALFSTKLSCKRNIHLSLRLQWLSKMVVTPWLHKLTICVI